MALDVEAIPGSSWAWPAANSSLVRGLSPLEYIAAGTVVRAPAPAVVDGLAGPDIA